MNIEKIGVQTPKSQLSFKAGKVRVFSDFDRTFLPSSHKDFIYNFDDVFMNGMRKYFTDFKRFLDRTREGLKFTLTTGRSFGEFETMAEASRKRALGMPLPDTLIVKNGGDEHIKIGSDADYYAGGEFPFRYDVTNTEKEENIRRISGWDGGKILGKIKEIFISHNLRIAEADSVQSPIDYGARSIFSDGKLFYEDRQYFDATYKSDWSVGFRKDGNTRLYIAYPYDMKSDPERVWILGELEKQINNVFDEVGVVKGKIFKTEIHDPNKCGGRPCVTYEPIVDDLVTNHIKYEYSEALTKHYDINEALKVAKKNDDLVVVAGDEVNDELMLNPFYFLGDELKNHKDFLSIVEGMRSPQKCVEQLEKYSELAKAFDELPFYGVIVKNESGTSALQNLIDAFGDGKYKKLVVVEYGHLQDGIKEAIKLHAQKNPKYKEKLSADLAKEISEGNSTCSTAQNIKPSGATKEEKSNLWKYILGGLGVMGIGAFIMHLHKKKNEKLAEIATTSSKAS